MSDSSKNGNLLPANAVRRHEVEKEPRKAGSGEPEVRLPSILFARFPFGASEHPDVTDWLVDSVVWAKTSGLFSDVYHYRRDDTPITMGRNEALSRAERLGVDYVLMVDSDMKPDAYYPTNIHNISCDGHAKQFLPTAFSWAQNQRSMGHPCVIGAPYCGPPPHENIFVFQWANKESGHPNADMSLDQFTREEAAKMSGIKPVAALPTGLILIDTKVLKKIEKPYTYYEYQTGSEESKASTEDVTFTRDLSLRGVPLFCTWDSWCGHWKMKCVGKPQLLTSDAIGEKYKSAVLRDLNIMPGENLVDIKRGDRLVSGKYGYQVNDL